MVWLRCGFFLIPYIDTCGFGVNTLREKYIFHYYYYFAAVAGQPATACASPLSGPVFDPHSPLHSCSPSWGLSVCLVFRPWLGTPLGESADNIWFTNVVVSLC